MVDLSALQALKDKPAKKPRTAPWEPLDLQTLHTGTYFACDPSLGATGVVLFEVFSFDRWAVHMAQKFVGGRTEGWEETLQSTAYLHQQLDHWVQTWIRSSDWGAVHAVHESPPTGGGKFLKPELSLLSGYAWRVATNGYPRLPMVRRQDHCKLICGNANADKAVHHAALKKFFPDIVGSELVTNEALRDALSIAIFAAHRGF